MALFGLSIILLLMQIAPNAFWVYLLIVHGNGGIEEKVERRPLSCCWPQ